MPIIATRASAAYGAGFSRVVTAPFDALGSYDALATVNVTSSVSSVTFSAIPNDYKHLQIRGVSVGTFGNQDVLMYFNGVNTSSNYTWHELRGTGTSATSGNAINQAFMFIASNSTDTQYPTSYLIDILDYSRTDKTKVVRTLSGKDLNGGGNASMFSGLAFTTNAVSSITIYTPGAFPLTQYSRFSLYGVK